MFDYNNNSELQSAYLAERQVSESMQAADGVIDIQDSTIEDDPNFSYDGFQVVRREFFAHINEPSITFNNCKVGFNSACINKLTNIEYVQFLVNPEKKILAVRPCREEDRDSYLWCSNSNNKRKPKQSTCKLFFVKIVSLMGWNPDYRYKLLGKIIRSNGEYLIVFDLTATEVYQRTISENQKTKTSRIPVFPQEWQNQFGLPYEEHRRSLQVNIVDGYAVYGVKDNASASQPIKTELPQSVDGFVESGPETLRKGEYI